MANITDESELMRLIKCAREGYVTAFVKRDYLGAMNSLAKKMQRDDETFEKSFTRMLKTPDGRDLYGAYRKARGASYTEPAAPASSATTDLSKSSPTWRQIEHLADILTEEAKAGGRVLKRIDAISAALRTPAGRELRKRFQAEAVEIAKRGVRV